MTEKELQELLSKRPALKVAGANTVVALKKESPVKTKFEAPSSAIKPNKTEAAYAHLLALEFPGCKIVFEGMALMLQCGHRYTPDWIIQTPDGLLCVEVKARGKNGFRHPSHQRARLAFDQARIDWPFMFRWAEKQNGVWEVKTYDKEASR